jgi:hypothetical protein
MSANCCAQRASEQMKEAGRGAQREWGAEGRDEVEASFRTTVSSTVGVDVGARGEKSGPVEGRNSGDGAHTVFNVVAGR